MLPDTACRLTGMSLVKQIRNPVMSLLIAVQVSGIVSYIANLIIDITCGIGNNIILTDVGASHIRLAVNAHKLSSKLC